MTGYVVDASVAIKWTVPELHSAKALAYLDPSLERHAPQLLLAEIANIVWKKCNRGEVTPEHSLRVADELRQADIVIHPMGDLMIAALSIALATGRSAYDCLYLALADSLSTSVVTSDLRLFRIRPGIISRPHPVRSRRRLGGSLELPCEAGSSRLPPSPRFTGAGQTRKLFPACSLTGSRAALMLGSCAGSRPIREPTSDEPRPIRPGVVPG